MMSLLILFTLALFMPNGNSFREQLENYLNKNLSGYKNYEYEILHMPDSYKSIELLKPNEFSLQGNLVYLPVKIVKKSGRLIKSIMTVKLKIFRNVFVTRKQINRKEKLSQDDFINKKEDITQIKGTPIYSLDKIESYRSKIMIKENEVLTSENIEEIPIVNSGDEMNAQLINGNVLITFKVYARQEGIAGQIITVIAKDNKLFKGKVLDSKNLNLIE